MKIRSYLLTMCLTSLWCSAHGESGIYLDSVVGQIAQGKVVAGEPLVFYLNLRNHSGQRVTDISHEFRIFTPDGADWHPHLFTYPFDSIYYVEWLDPDGEGPLGWHTSVPGDTQIFAIVHRDARSDHDANPLTPDEFGRGSDTVVVFGLEGIGIEDGLDLRAWRFVIDSIDEGSVGRTICLDSCRRDEQHWFWATDSQLLVPSWDGPHCFEIVSCCQGVRGNINLDLQDTIDISDLTTLVGWMFKSGGAPTCMLEADIDANGTHDVTDLTYLVSYMFKDGPAPAACP